MRYKTIVAASAAAAAAAITCGSAASASTPDWLTLASVQTDEASLLPAVCGAEASGTFIDPACQSILGSEQTDTAERFGMSVPETPAGYGAAPSAVNVDLRDFAKWEVCGVAVAAEAHDVECDNSISGEREPVSGSGVSLVNVDTRGAFDWSVCGVAVLESAAATEC